MNTQEKIEQYLRAVPKPLPPDSLVDKLRKDVIVREVQKRQPALRRFFAPSGERISRWRVAAAAVLTAAVLLPLSYGATRLIKRFIAISQLPAIKVDFPGTGALSPDGKHFAGITWDSELVVIDTSTGEQRKLAEHCNGPVVWSADGSEIAVVSRSGEKKTLLALSLKTGKTRSLMEDPPRLQDWGPDGKLILGERIPESGVPSAVMVNLESKEETVLAEEGASPRFSPNADCLSYVTKEANRSILHLRKVDGTSHVKYTDFPGDISRPIWSPNGAYIVFTGTQKGIDRQHKDLWALRVEGNRFIGAPLPVVPDVEQMQFFNWSQNGQLAYGTGFQLGGIFTLPVDSQTGKAAGAPRQLVRAGGIPTHCWSPDGKQIGVLVRNTLTVVSAPTGEQIRQVSLPEHNWKHRGMSWSPDGQLIFFSGKNGEQKTGLFLITVKTGEVRLLLPVGQGIFQPSSEGPVWSPDSKTIAYAYNSDVYVMNVEGGQPRRITVPPQEREYKGYVIRPVFMPDGRSVAYIVGDRRILATTIDGKETREIFHLKNEKFDINIFDVSPDGRHIVFTPGTREIYCAATDGGEPFRIADLSNLGDQAWAWSPKWSPKGDAVTFYVRREEYRYWVMENFLPPAEAGGR